MNLYKPTPAVKAILFSIILFIIAADGVAQNKLIITPYPQTIFIELAENKQVVNFDFLVSNKSTDTIYLNKLSVSVFDKNDQLLHARFFDNNGTAPSIFTLPKRIWNGQVTQLLFNPFSEFELSAPISRLEYEWVFSNSADSEFTYKNTVLPKAYTQNNTLSFPLKGKVLVYDAHDFNSHHRRFDYNFDMIRQLGLRSNFMRYAYDFVLLDNNNRQTSGNGKEDKDYFSLGAKVYAVAAGRVVYAVADHKDDKNFNVPKLKENPLELYGNCIAIQHADSSISIYGHLKQYSIQLKPGDMVKAGQQIGTIGVSGSSFFPHLHFEMRTSVLHNAEGLPSYFKNIYLVEGNKKRKLKSGLAETGNIVESK